MPELEHQNAFNLEKHPPQTPGMQFSVPQITERDARPTPTDPMTMASVIIGWLF